MAHRIVVLFLVSWFGTIVLAQVDERTQNSGRSLVAPRVYPTAGATITRVSTGSGGADANGASQVPAISADGRFVAFASDASNLVAGDTNGVTDVFVYDRQTRQTTRVSVASDGTEANGPSAHPSISADGRYVVFDSAASNLVPYDGNGLRDVFRHDLKTGETICASASFPLPAAATGNGASEYPVVSGDGQRIAFETDASDLIFTCRFPTCPTPQGDLNGVRDVYVADVDASGLVTRQLASVGVNDVQGNDRSIGAAISADGESIAFTSYATNLTADTNVAPDVFVRYLAVTFNSPRTERVSVATGGAEANAGSGGASITENGRYVAFTSVATNLVPDDTNGVADVFVFDRWAGKTVRASVAADGSQANGESGPATISADGRYVAFRSAATNLVPVDVNGAADIFLKDLYTGEVTLVSMDGAGNQGNGASGNPALTADGREVAFDSAATNLVPGDANGVQDIFVAGPFGMRMLLPAGDYDADGKADVGVFRPTEHAWYLARSTGDGVRMEWGTTGDIPVPGDYDGDGATDVAVFRPSEGAWYIVYSRTGAAARIEWGAPGDVPVPADYDGDGMTDIAVFRPTTGAWYIVKSGGGAVGVYWGTAGDIPVPADYDGDGKADIAVFRPSNGAWYIDKTTGGAVGISWGTAGDIPVPADYDGDGKADLAVFRPATGAWYLARTSAGAIGFLWGMAGDMPVVGDFDGDGRADVGVFRADASSWYIIESGGGVRAVAWGAVGDLPV